MSCCGKKRERLTGIQRTSSPQKEPAVVEGAPEDAGVRTFEYMGPGVLTLRGAVSGRLYHFTHPGVRVKVSLEDSRAMMAESALRLLR